MPPRNVSLNSAGHPYIRIRVYGISEDLAKEFDALVDTGFTGFLHLPLTLALPLGLTLLSTANYTIGDGSTISNLIAFGTIDYEGQKTFGPISLEQDPKCKDVLIGMEFIHLSKHMLILCKEGAVMLDMEEMAQIAKSAQEALEKTNKALTSLENPDQDLNKTLPLEGQNPN